MSNFTTSDGLGLHYEDEGDGLPLLCLSGLTRTTRDFDYVAPHLSGVRMIRMDYRGRGRSDWDKTWENYTLPMECRDILELLQTLSLSQVAILGTSRGGLNGMGLASASPDTLLGLAFNDVGPDIDAQGIEVIMTYLGRNPSAKTHEEAAAALKHTMTGFSGVPDSRWLQEARTHFAETEGGLKITYDPALRTAIEAAGHQAAPDLWPYFDALPNRPLALIRGENSDLLTAATAEEMQRRRPNMITALVPDRGHVPFLDEPESLDALHRWLDAIR